MREQSFDVVFNHIKMPGMDGVELAERVKASQPWTPVVIITGYGTAENEVRARAAGVSDFVRKPLSPEMIEESAAHALREAAPEVAPEARVAPVEQVNVEVVAKESRIKNIALFLAAPFIGLAYAVMLPVVGMVMLAKVAMQARKAKNQ
jgi:DNA-binding NtrC family response regulator